MTHVDLRAAITSWVAEAVENSASKPSVVYWVDLSLHGPDWLPCPRVEIMLFWNKSHASAVPPWPPRLDTVTEATRKALGELGILKTE